MITTKKKKPVKYAIEKYNRFPIYEPAEGGYYYEGRCLEYYDVYETLNSANSALKELVNANNDELNPIDDGQGNTEGLLVYSKHGKYANAYSINHRYIGDGFEYFVTPLNRVNRKNKASVPYE